MGLAVQGVKSSCGVLNACFCISLPLGNAVTRIGQALNKSAMSLQLCLVYDYSPCPRLWHRQLNWEAVRNLHAKG